jgi:hypothetical protein
MNATRTLTFLWTPVSVAVSIFVVLLTALLCYLAWRRSGYRRSIGALELLRLVIVGIAAVLFNQPEWIEEYRPEEKPSIAILWDGSGSMGTRDVTLSGSPGAALLSRAEAITALTEAPTWSPLLERADVVVESFSSAGAERGTDLHDPLTRSAEKHENLLGVVLISDGDWNEGQPPVNAAARLRTRGVPVFAVPVGSANRLPDVELLSLDAPTFGVAGKAVRIPFTIESSLPRDHFTTVTLRSSDGDEVTRDLRISAMGRTTDFLTWQPRSTGDFNLTLDVPPQLDETLTDNNRLTVPIAIRESKLKVLIVESIPRWEYRYLRNALSRDPGVDVSCLLFHPGLGKVGGGSKDYIREFPAGLDELSKYDVVFLGDVGLYDGQLTVEECHSLRGLVEHQASGLVFLPGWQGRQFSLLETELADLFPVLLDAGQTGGWGSRTPGHFELTESGQRSLLTKLADTREDNADVWEDLPGFQWYAPVLRAKAGSEVLAVHKDISNQNGRLPLLVTRTFGAGKVMFMGTDAAWRWRQGVEDKYHYRFWGQVVRWMAYQRNMAKGESMRLYYSPDQPQMRQTLALNANVMDTSGEPLAGGDVTARVVAPSGKAETIRFTAAGEEWGMFHGKYLAEEAGRHEVTLACKQTGAALETSFFVQGVAPERVGRPARPEVLEEIARVSHGRVIEPDRIDDIVRSLSSLPEPEPSVRRVQLWSHPLIAGILVLLLGVFWVARKVVGLI